MYVILPLGYYLLLSYGIRQGVDVLQDFVTMRNYIINRNHDAVSTVATSPSSQLLGGLRPPIHHGSKRWFVVHEP